MTNTIQSVFLSVTHVFVSILKLLKKIWLSKMYPYFKLLIFGYISRFLTKISTLLGLFQALNTNLPLFFVLDLRNMVKKRFTKRYHIRGKTRFWGFNPLWGTFPWSKSKNSFGFKFSAQKNPRRVENFVKNRLIQPNINSLKIRIQLLGPNF